MNDISAINSEYKTVPVKQGSQNASGQDFGTVFDATKGLLDETNTLQNKASAEEVKFALGLSDNTHDMMIAAQKATVALQYTNAIRTNMIQAYQTIMNMQI